MRLDTLRSWSLWTAQVVLAALFAFSGATKFVFSAEMLVGTSQLPVEFFRFIGVCEILGALGLVLPGALRVRRNLTPIAAGALVIIMTGAVGMSVQGYSAAAAILPGTTGILCALVAYGRRGWLPTTPVAAPPAARGLPHPFPG